MRLVTTIDMLQRMAAVHPDGSASKAAIEHAARVCEATRRWRAASCTGESDCYPVDGDHGATCELTTAHAALDSAMGQAPRIYDPASPLRTIVSQGEKFALCAAFLAKHYSDRGTGGWPGGAAADRPMDTVTVRDHHSLVAANLIRYNGDRAGAERIADVGAPIGTQDTSRRFALVASFLARYNGTSTGQRADAPLGTVDTRDRFGLVTVTIDGEEYVIVDIGMRMLTPRELFRAQGFPESYQIDPVGPRGKPLTKTAQIRMCGNAVVPQVAAAIVRTNLLGGDA